MVVKLQTRFPAKSSCAVICGAYRPTARRVLRRALTLVKKRLPGALCGVALLAAALLRKKRQA